MFYFVQLCLLAKNAVRASYDEEDASACTAKFTLSLAVACITVTVPIVLPKRIKTR